MYVLYWIDVPHFIFSVCLESIGILIVAKQRTRDYLAKYFVTKLSLENPRKGKFKASNQYKSPDSLWYVMYWQAVLKLEATSGSAARNRYIELLHPRRIQSP